MPAAWGDGPWRAPPHAPGGRPPHAKVPGRRECGRCRHSGFRCWADSCRGPGDVAATRGSGRIPDGRSGKGSVGRRGRRHIHPGRGMAPHRGCHRKARIPSRGTGIHAAPDPRPCQEWRIVLRAAAHSCSLELAELRAGTPIRGRCRGADVQHAGSCWRVVPPACQAAAPRGGRWKPLSKVP